MKKTNKKVIEDILRRFESWGQGKSCTNGAPCALAFFAEMGFSINEATRLLHLFEEMATWCVLRAGFSCPLKKVLGWEPLTKSDTFDPAQVIDKRPGSSGRIA